MYREDRVEGDGKIVCVVVRGNSGEKTLKVSFADNSHHDGLNMICGAPKVVPLFLPLKSVVNQYPYVNLQAIKVGFM